MALRVPSLLPKASQQRRPLLRFRWSHLLAVPAGLALTALSLTPSEAPAPTSQSVVVQSTSAASNDSNLNASLALVGPSTTAPAPVGLIPPSLLGQDLTKPLLPAPATALAAPLEQAPVPVTAAAAPAPMAHLPEWVQTNVTANFWSGPDERAVRFNTLPAWTFLHVLAVQGERLEVQYDGSRGGVAGPGWISVSVVQPSDASGAWLQSTRDTQLWNGPTAAAKSVQTVSQGAVMRVQDGQQQNRVPVTVYASDFSRVLASGWIATQDVRAANAPRQSVNTQTTQSPPAPFGSQQDFINAVGQAAKATQQKTGVPASVTVAQAILESDWGQSLLTRQANNYFGIKAMGSLGDDGAVWMRTMEYDDAGNSYYVNAPFRAYKSLGDSVADHANLFTSLPRYSGAMQAKNDPDLFAQRITDEGYCTDPNYPSKLVGLMQKFNLYRFDS